MLTEDQVQRSFRNLFKTKDFPPENFDKAENLLDELRAESPLRHRLSVELDELRKISDPSLIPAKATKAKAKAKPKAKLAAKVS
ncbi:hypothetical protein ETAA8_68990 [Anatilimnocola aggregata]|uniref:Uncharacterized protein n=1 Tax=Anatilimnocola aggregata TaxID=2528021 RepID=A0A517YNF4_9BACT|nr:hypothetical protein [Anatilimnocola aggregata]QDU31739.1 hypothetical protein ETAA8_68990 [Anatilimnocola aggregata]